MRIRSSNVSLLWLATKQTAQVQLTAKQSSGKIVLSGRKIKLKSSNDLVVLMMADVFCGQLTNKRAELASK